MKSGMGDNAFKDICDQFSGTVDETQFERFRFTRDEAPKLKRLVELVTASFEGRDDLTLAEEGAEGGQAGFKRFILKAHGQRTVAIAVMLKDGLAILGAEPVERSAYTISCDPISADFEEVDEAWIQHALGQLIRNIRAAG